MISPEAHQFSTILLSVEPNTLKDLYSPGQSHEQRGLIMQDEIINTGASTTLTQIYNTLDELKPTLLSSTFDEMTSPKNLDMSQMQDDERVLVGVILSALPKFDAEGTVTTTSNEFEWRFTLCGSGQFPILATVGITLSQISGFGITVITDGYGKEGAPFQPGRFNFNLTPTKLGTFSPKFTSTVLIAD